MKKTFRDPIIQAKEMLLEMEYQDLTKAQLAKKLNTSKARVTQILNLLKLPDELIREVEEIGDNRDRMLVTERTLRRKLTPINEIEYEAPAFLACHFRCSQLLH